MRNGGSSNGSISGLDGRGIDSTGQFLMCQPLGVACSLNVLGVLDSLSFSLFSLSKAVDSAAAVDGTVLLKARKQETVALSLAHKHTERTFADAQRTWQGRKKKEDRKKKESKTEPSFSDAFSFSGVYMCACVFTVLHLL